MVVSDEQAKAVTAVAEFGTKSLDTLGAAGGGATRAIGPLASDFVGWAFGDDLKISRWEKFQLRWHEACERLNARGVNFERPSPSVSIPLMEGACDEADPDLAELWTRLLANAMDPARKKRVRLRFIEAVKKMDPLDALAFQTLFNATGVLQPSVREFVAQRLTVAPDDIEVSFANLFDLGFIAIRGNYDPERRVFSDVYLTSVGRQFAQAIAS